MSIIYKAFNIPLTVSDFLDKAENSGKTRVTVNISKSKYVDTDCHDVLPHYWFDLSYNGNTKKISNKTDWERKGPRSIFKKNLTNIFSLVKERKLRVIVNVAS